MRDIRETLNKFRSGTISLEETEELIYGDFNFYVPLFHIGDQVKVLDKDNDINIDNTVITNVYFHKKHGNWVYEIDKDDCYFFEKDLTKL